MMIENQDRIGIENYEWDEPGTWGHCQRCRFDVTLDEDGFIAPHKRQAGGFLAVLCGGSRTEPTTRYRNEYPAPPPPHVEEDDDD